MAAVIVLICTVRIILQPFLSLQVPLISHHSQAKKFKKTESFLQPHRGLPCYILSNQKQHSCKKRCGPQKGHGEKRCEIQGGGQEMAVMVG